MSDLTITLPREYGYVVLSAFSTAFLSIWHGIYTGTYRKAAKVGYPRPYALESFDNPKPDEKGTLSEQDEQKLKEYQFNCAQRAHTTFNEGLPAVLPCILVAGLKWPITSSVLGAAWTFGRFMYARGYVRADKEGGRGRLIGSPFYVLSQMILTGMIATMGVQMIMA